MKIAVFQNNTTVGAVQTNADHVIRCAQRAEALGADLALFPELSIPGYPPWDLLERPSFIDACADVEARIAAEVPPSLTVIFGNVRRRPIPPTFGRALQNVATVVANGRVQDHVVKSLLPTYDVFDEARFFEPARDQKPLILNVGGRKVGITICEDIWNDDQLWATEDLWRDKSAGGHRLYAHDPVQDIAAAGADVIVNLSASPWARGKRAVRDRVLRHLCRRYGVWVAYANHIGANDGLLFDGHSVVHNPEGHCVAQGPCWTNGELVVDLDAAPTEDMTVAEEGITAIRDALSMGIADYFRKTGFETAVIGLSGGIDSAVTAYLAVHALGAQNVIGVGMPSEYSSEHSVADARSLAENLGIRFHLVPIASTFNAYREALAPAFAGYAEDITEENLQSRVRGGLLMAMANKFNAIVLSTGNKSEAATGYATLYGDTVGALCVLADLYKHQVYAVARLANEERTTIP
ncbi:MAG: NAD(+) synthase, partial [Myxococcota bacterium]